MIPKTRDPAVLHWGYLEPVENRGVTRLGEMLLESQSKTPFPRWMKWIAFVAGFLLVADGIRVFAFHEMLVGAIVLYISGYTKRIYLTEEGLVREVGTWIMRNHTVLGWNEIQHVGLAKRGSKMMAFFEKDVTGWKVLFNTEDEPRLREILSTFIPHVDVEIIGNQ